MRIETIERVVLTFEELNDEQKNKVYDNLRDINVDGHWWYECVKDDFHEVLYILGFSNIESYFSGFWSQGDGASFKAMFDVPKNHTEMWKRLDKLEKEIPYFLKDRKVLKSAIEQLNFLEEVKEDVDTIEIEQNGRYYHSNTMYCYHDTLLEVCKALADIYYSKLEEHYDYMTSNEEIKETIIANEYEFYEDTLQIA